MKTIRLATPLPSETDTLYLSDGGLETTLIFHEGVDLPCFAAFTLLDSVEGLETLRAYYRAYAALARQRGRGFVLESPTWRANPDWAVKLGYNLDQLDSANRNAIGLMTEIRDQYESSTSPMPISGCVGPRGDGYQPGALMSPAEAEQYHGRQIRVFRECGADLVTGITLNYVEEAIGVANAAAAADIPAVISFTAETDGRLPTGHSIGEAIALVDSRAQRPPAYYMINCAHPTHFRDALPTEPRWLSRIQGVRANASCRSHAELDNSSDLDDGDPRELADQYRELRSFLPALKVLGGCCGTDLRHIEAICASCAAR